MNNYNTLNKNQITGNALYEVEKLIDSLNYQQVFKNKKEITHISIKDLITAYKWLPQLCNIVTFLPIFSDIIDNGYILIENVPKFDNLIYKVMGE